MSRPMPMPLTVVQPGTYVELEGPRGGRYRYDDCTEHQAASDYDWSCSYLGKSGDWHEWSRAIGPAIRTRTVRS